MSRTLPEAEQDLGATERSLAVVEKLRVRFNHLRTAIAYWIAPWLAEVEEDRW